MKSFKECLEIDLSDYVQKKPTFFKDKTGKSIKTDKSKWLDYIEWAVLLKLLYTECEAEKVFFTSEIDTEKPNTLLIRMEIDGNKYETSYPIINGNKIVSNPDQMDIHRAELRGFVKCVAINTGLGLSMWMKDEQQNGETIKPQVKKEPKTDISFILMLTDVEEVKSEANKIARGLDASQREEIHNHIKKLEG